jgi:uncharacterized membrane protein affecting hemolysin expression
MHNLSMQRRNEMMMMKMTMMMMMMMMINLAMIILACLNFRDGRLTNKLLTSTALTPEDDYTRLNGSDAKDGIGYQILPCIPLNGVRKTMKTLLD